MLALLIVFMDLPAAVLEPDRTPAFRLMVALAILLIGWLASKIPKGLIFRLLPTARFDVASERAGIDDIPAQADIRQSPAELVAVLVSWLALLGTLVAGVSALGLSQVSEEPGIAPELVRSAFVILFGAVALAFGLGCKDHARDWMA